MNSHALAECERQACVSDASSTICVGGASAMGDGPSQNKLHELRAPMQLHELCIYGAASHQEFFKPLDGAGSASSSMR
jgi:hypothetical protein